MTGGTSPTPTLLATLLGMGLTAVLAATPSVAAQDDWWLPLEGRGSGMHVIEEDSVYRVSGFTYADIFSDMQRNGPGNDEIGVRLGVHASQWRWSYRYSADANSCSLVEATVLLKSTIVLPEWTNHSTAPPQISDGWRPFLDALRTHEEGHRNRAKAQGVFLWQSLLGLAAADCDTLQSMVDATADRIITEGRESQLAYDRDTGHGRTQGAIWPPPH